MASLDALKVFLASLGARSYYEILRLAPNADEAAIKSAFHEFSLLYHPDRYVGAEREVGQVASEIYKRGVEAYRCLSRKGSRERYDRGLPRGRIRFDPSRRTTPPPMPATRTLEQVAKSPRAKQFAAKADRLLSIGKLDDARVQIVSAVQCEPDNAELGERLQILYEALALEPL